MRAPFTCRRLSEWGEAGKPQRERSRTPRLTELNPRQGRQASEQTTSDCGVDKRRSREGARGALGRLPTCLPREGRCPSPVRSSQSGRCHRRGSERDEGLAGPLLGDSACSPVRTASQDQGTRALGQNHVKVYSSLHSEFLTQKPTITDKLI